MANKSLVRMGISDKSLRLKTMAYLRSINLRMSTARITRR